MIKSRTFVFSGMLFLGVVCDAAADIGLQFGIESFRWREFDAGGARLLEESGPRYHLGAEWRRPFGAGEPLWLQVQGSVYFASVDYDGQACTLSGTCTPFMSETDYRGVQANATIARRYGRESGGEVFAGGGLDTWRRSVKGRANVQGAIEDWTTLSLLVGGGGYWTASANRYQLRAGIKYPIYTEELPDSYNVTLAPEGKASLFAKLSMDFLNHGKPSWGLGVYYDSYRFAQSDQERDGSVLIWQPKSTQEVFGLYATVYLR